MSIESHIKSRIFGLDALRCLAILFVLYLHASYIFEVDHISKTYRIFYIDGVGLFFVLSGFLIGGILIKTLESKGNSFTVLKSFWINRWWRTIPAYYFVLFLMFAAYLKIGVVEESHISYLKKFLKYITFTQNIRTGQLKYYPESWSLSVEEWFYLIIPSVTFMLVRYMSVKKSIVIVCVMIVIMCNLIRIERIGNDNITDFYSYIFRVIETVPTRLDAIVFGVIGAYLKYYDYNIWYNYRNKLFYMGVAILIVNNVYYVLSGYGFYTLYLQYTIMAIGTLMLIPKLETIRTRRGYIAKAVSFISLISYSVYLLNNSVFFTLVEPNLPNHLIIKLISFLLFSIVGGYLLYITVEKWGMKQRNKINMRKELRN